MIEKRFRDRESLKEIGSIESWPIYCDDNTQISFYVLYDIFDNDEEFVEIWIPYNKAMHG